MKRLQVGVLYGGRSSEHEVSLASAAAVFANLDPARYDAVPVYVHRDGRWSLPSQPPSMTSAADVIERSLAQSDKPPTPAAGTEAHLVAHPGREALLTIQRGSHVAGQDDLARVRSLPLDVVFPVIHGPFGEDGTLQGLLELANVPYVGAGVLSSAVAMDKAVAKTLFAARRLPLVKHMVVSPDEWDGRRAQTLERLTEQLPFPLFVKPANLGSSVGISKANDGDALEQAIDEARQFDRKVIVEVAVHQPRELECAVLGNDDAKASLPGEIIPAGEFYDYEAKYLHDDSQLIVPAPLTTDQTAQIQTMALKAFRAIEGAGMARVDFLMDGSSGQLFLNEVNTIPGFTTISMFAKLWEASGTTYTALLDTLIELALDRHTQKQELRTSAT